MRPLSFPSPDGRYEALWKIINVNPEDHLMVLAWILECYRCDTPYPVLELSGEQGSAKSSTQTILRTLIDPNEVMLRARPKTVEDIYVAARNNHLLSFENLSNITSDMSDAFCTVATGGGTAGRTLYTNDEETILKAHNPVVLNGIAAVIIRQDLLDRAVTVSLPVINVRRTEQELKQEIQQALPVIFGGLLNLFSQALEHLPDVNIDSKDLPRMADFARLGEAMGAALGLAPKKWLDSYKSLRQDAIRRSIDSNLVAQTCIELVTQHYHHKGTVKSCLDRLKRLLPDQYDISDHWPKSPKGLADSLRRIAPSMRLIGVYVSVEGKPRRDGYYCTIEEIPGVFYR